MTQEVRVNSLPKAHGLAWARFAALGLYVAVLVAAVLAWRDPDLRRHFTPAALAAFGRELLAMPAGPMMVLGGYVVAVMLAVPVAVLITVGALVFGPWPGMAYALSGMVLGATVTYGIGHWGGATLVDRWTTDGRLYAMAQTIKRRGLWAVIMIRVLPVAPFIVVNLAAGAFRVRLRDFVLGTFLGLAPGTVLISLFTDRLAAVWRNPDPATYAALGGFVAVALVCAIGVMVWRRRGRSSTR